MAHITKFLIITLLLGAPQLYASHETQQAVVRQGNTVCSEEKEFIAYRKHAIKNELEQLLGMPLAPEEVPTIALCCSGGGFRAMISTLGSLNINVQDHGRNSDTKKNRHFFAKLFTYLFKLLGIDLA